MAMKAISLAALAVASMARGETDARLCGPAAGRALADFAGRLDRTASATEVLRGWCAEHALANPPVIRAERDSSTDKPANAAIRGLLRAAPGEPVRYRRVRLVCGTRVLSEADNWYRPSRLTLEMNRQLDETETPFGAVVRLLNFHRRPLADQFEAPGEGLLAPLAPAVMRRRAVLIDARGEPFSLVTETYAAALLDYPGGC
jgi:chorismate-pyruvate lyase